MEIIYDLKESKEGLKRVSKKIKYYTDLWVLWQKSYTKALERKRSYKKGQINTGENKNGKN